MKLVTEEFGAQIVKGASSGRDLGAKVVRQGRSHESLAPRSSGTGQSRVKGVVGGGSVLRLGSRAPCS